MSFQITQEAVDWFQDHFVFHNNVHEKTVGSKNKMKLDFLKIFNNAFSNNLIKKCFWMQ